MSAATGSQPKIEIRPMTRDDLPSYVGVGAYAYNAPRAEITEWLESLESQIMLGLYEDGELSAAMGDSRFDIWLDGRLVKANGIGAIASAPTGRHKGYVRRLLAEHLRQLKTDGVLFSMLYPFRYDFYRRMGWGPAVRMPEFKVPIGQFAAFGRRTGRVRLILYSVKGELHPAAGESLESVTAKLRPVYEAAVSGYNLAVRRGDQHWKQMLEMRRGRHVFVWEDGDGRVQGYLALRSPGEPEPTQMAVRELHAVTPDAWRGLFYFIHSHEAQHSRVLLAIPPEHPMLDLLSDPRALEIGKWTTGPMARVVDVGGVLAEKAASRKSRSGLPTGGRCLIAIKDELVPWNDGLWSVSADGRIDRVAPSAMPDLEMEIAAFSILAAGAREVDDLLGFGLATGRPGSGLDYARGLFSKRPLWHTEYY